MNTGSIAPSLTHEAKPMADRVAQALVFGMLRRIAVGRIVVRQPDGEIHDFGDKTADPVRVDVHSPVAYRLLASGGSAGFGEAYIAGHWTTDDLTRLLQVIIKNVSALDRSRGRANRVVGPAGDLFRRLRRQDKARDRRNIAAHYDLSNDFFELFLDETMTYSSGFWADDGATLYEAQIEKIDRLCRKLDLQPGDQLLEIGTGWGALACHAAENYGCTVTTTTLSREQYEYATKRVHDRGLVDRVTVRNDDYRDITGTYDKIVSVEMIEAVDWREHDVFFQKCADLLAPNGVMALQAITIPDQRYQRAKNTVDFIKAFIFPGGCLPSVSAIATTTARSTDLVVTDVEDFGHDYARTLLEWRVRLAGQRHRLADLDMDGQFERMWDFYLCYCEAGFRERHVSVVQAVLARPQYRTSAHSG